MNVKPIATNKYSIVQQGQQWSPTTVTQGQRLRLAKTAIRFVVDITALHYIHHNASVNDFL